MAKFYVLVALCLSGSALGQVPERGDCPKVEVQADLDIPQIMGRWYEAIRYFHNFELIAQCNVIDYSFGEPGIINVNNSFISGFSGNPDAVQGYVNMLDPEEPAKMSVKFPLTTPGDISNYWILGTDYDSYMVIYGCTNYDKLNLKYAWILTRDRVPDKSVMTRAYKVIDKNNINTSNFWDVEQASCEKSCA